MVAHDEHMRKRRSCEGKGEVALSPSSDRAYYIFDLRLRSLLLLMSFHEARLCAPPRTTSTKIVRRSPHALENTSDHKMRASFRIASDRPCRAIRQRGERGPG